MVWIFPFPTRLITKDCLPQAYYDLCLSHNAHIRTLIIQKKRVQIKISILKRSPNLNRINILQKGSE